MIRRYFDVFQDMSINNLLDFGKPTWSKPEEFQFWWLTTGAEYTGPTPLVMDINLLGEPVAFNLSYIDVPVVQRELADALVFQGVSAQLVPVQIDGLQDEWVIVNFLDVIDCLDEERTDQWDRWTEEDGVPSKIGQYSSVVGLIVDPERIPLEVKAFRIKNLGELIVSQDIKELIERWPNSGVVFEEKTPKPSLKSI